MEGVKFHSSPVMSDEEENDNTTESGTDSPPSSFLNDPKMSSSKKSKKATPKRVVSVPIKEVEGSRLKAENATPPSDSWAWRKYGQKPIKGSPYPRAYYRCSSSKGCPARKQVERSKVDPTMLLVTYSSEHNHSWPLTSRNHHYPNNLKHEKISRPLQPDNSGSEESPLLTNPAEFGWFGGIDATPTTILEDPIFLETTSPDADVSMFYPMREEDESLFADLGELPECSAVFKHHRGVVQIC